MEFVRVFLVIQPLSWNLTTVQSAVWPIRVAAYGIVGLLGNTVLS